MQQNENEGQTAEPTPAPVMPEQVQTQPESVADGEEQPPEVVRRVIDSHKVNPANDRLTIDVLDDPGSGGANHHYRISGFDTASNPSDPFVARHGTPAIYGTILFQNGPIAEVGVNGVTHEALLAIIEDRMQAFQAGPYACDENRVALIHLQACIRFLKMRTLRRTEAGTEGTHKGS